MILNSFLRDKFLFSRHVFKVSAAILLVFGCTANLSYPDLKNKNIICFGDSLTEGTGAGPGEDFPSFLSQKLNRPVINAGQRGNTTGDALKRIEADVLEKNPGLVIVEFGANDYLQKIPQEETFKNLNRMVTLLQQRGATVVLVAVRVGVLFDEYDSSFKKISREKKVILVSDILKGIFTNPQLKSDGLHPNGAGYKIMADRVYKAILPIIKNSF